MGRTIECEHLTAAPCGLLIFDADRTVVASNARLRHWLGMAASDLDGMPVSHLFSMASRVVFETSLVPLLALWGQTEGASLDLKTANGDNVPVLLSAETLGEGAERVTHMVFLQATARRNFERDLAKARAEAEANLSMKQREGELREQFVAILGHDLRNPLASIRAATRMLSNEDLSEQGRAVLQLTRGSVKRMSRLIDNILDFARNRLGGGIVLDMTDGAALEAEIRQVVEESRATEPDCDVRLDLALSHPVPCDVPRIGQLLSNLLGNALMHGDRLQPIEISATTPDAATLVVGVTNRGDPIPPSAMGRLFDPFVRSPGSAANKGMGLGLYIASEIARAHDGRLDVRSDDAETSFTFRMGGEPGAA